MESKLLSIPYIISCLVEGDTMYELMIELNSESEKPLYEQIYEYIKKEIQQGRIQSHDKLPSTRLLAKNLQISRSTVDLAYEQLVSEGYIESIACKGFYVCQIEGLYQISQNTENLDCEIEQKKDFVEYDFSPNGIDLLHFPYNTWRKITKNALLEDNRELFQLGSPLGEYDLRQTIGNYLHQARGVNCHPNQILLGSGNDYLLMILSQILGKDHVVAMENPTYKQAYQTFRKLNYKVNCIELDKDGMNVEALNKTDSNIAYVMPSHQYPLGVVMPIKRRMELLNWAFKGENRYIIEDDYDSEFRYKGKPIPSLQGYDGNEKVIYIGTFSKSIAPAIRISYMVLPKHLMKIYKEYGFYASTVSRIDQLIVNNFMKEGYYERHLNKMRAIYKNKHDILLNGLKEIPLIKSVTGENAGVHVLAHFSEEIKQDWLIDRAKEQNVKVYGLSDYYIKEDGTPDRIKETTIILGYASIFEEDIKEAVARLKIAWRNH